MMKRIFDIVFSLTALVLLAPVFLVVSVAVMASGGRPVFSTSKRIGKDLKPFNLFRFRITSGNAPIKEGADQLSGKRGLSRAGKFLAMTGIERLPELVNVLYGEMSIVGPKPEARKYVTKFRADFREIFKVRPGMIDAAALGMGRAVKAPTERQTEGDYYYHILLPERIKLLKDYTKKPSLMNDLKLMGLAVSRRIYPKDAVISAIRKLTPYRRGIVVALQLGIFALSFHLAFLAFHNGRIPEEALDLFLVGLPLLLALRIVLLFVFSLDKGLWRYANLSDLINIILATSAGSAIFFILSPYVEEGASYPASIYIFDWSFNIFLLGGIRLFRRLHESSIEGGWDSKRVIVIGAGDAAEMLIRDIGQSSHYNYRIIGLIDDDLRKKGLKIRNVPIMGTRGDLAKIVEAEEPDEFLIAIPSASPKKLQELFKELRSYGLPIKKLPPLWNLVSGRGSFDKLDVVSPEDVLFRAPTCDKCDELTEYFSGKRVLITGAGGSIGSELSKQVFSLNPSALVLYEKHEESLFRLDNELRPNCSTRSGFVFPVIGDILDKARLDSVMERFRPEVILHAAAYKHVPLMEENPYEAFKTNTVGTRAVAESAARHGTGCFLFISTDKAVNPMNIMGMTKKLAEEVVLSLSKKALGTKFLIVRFGNVIGSSGSVVPIFTEQIKRGGPVTVTHPEIVRYFMTIPEAANLVLQSVMIGEGGEVFVLDMGKPVKILDLAKRMIALYGYRPGRDLAIEFTGLRPGEKLFEELFNTDERTARTSNPRIHKALSDRETNGRVLESLDSLNDPELFASCGGVGFFEDFLNGKRDLPRLDSREDNIVKFPTRFTGS